LLDEERAEMKFLVLWNIDVHRLTPEAISAAMKQPAYGKKLEADGKLECRYHWIGKHGGAWIYDVGSNEELDRLLATAPVYNFAHYEVMPLARMSEPETVAGKPNTA
jgi:muconolactone delta-isomerase